ncbi:helix-turn-helix domain-containing protein [Streptomyces sp. NPDC087844]|uniref:helix-turn-helix domain-containing protein n=1 Tax=Streptomyces sp. NPDC087844 TaxID=3365805 RepID=UPI0038263D6B
MIRRNPCRVRGADSYDVPERTVLSVTEAFGVANSGPQVCEAQHGRAEHTYERRTSDARRAAEHSTWRTRRARQLAGGRWSAGRSTSMRGWPAVSGGRSTTATSNSACLRPTDLAGRTGMTQPQVLRMEGGDTVPPLPLLRRLAKALDGTPEPDHRRGCFARHLYPVRRLYPSLARSGEDVVDLRSYSC